MLNDCVVSGAGVGVVDVGVVDPAGRTDTVRPLVARKSDDVWYVEYTPLVDGLHSVNIFFAGKPIPNSPYPVAVARGTLLSVLYAYLELSSELLGILILGIC